MNGHPAPPFDAAAWFQAWQETWLAGLWPGLVATQRAQRLDALIAAAQRDSPLYRRRARNVRTLAGFEPVDKSTLMRHFDDWATDRRITHAAAADFLARPDHVADAFLGDYLLWTSSGTSGVPGWYVQDARSLAAYDAIDALRLRGASPLQPALGSWGLGQRFAFVGASGGHFAGLVSLKRLQRIVAPPWRPEIVFLSVQQPLREVAAALAHARPTVLITYPSAAEALAQMHDAGELELALREVWVGGEQLSAAQRAHVAQSFGCTVRNNYGASECFSIAWECAHGRLHLNDDWVIVEPVDASDRPVPAGEWSDALLITNLANRTQPLIRYRLDDRVRVLPQPCTCGSPFTPIEVSGRSADTLQLPDARRRPVAILPLALETVIEEGAGLTRFQVIDHVRRGAHELEIRFEPTQADPAAAFERCRATIERYLAEQGVTRTRCVPGAAPPAREATSGKLRRVMRSA